MEKHTNYTVHTTILEKANIDVLVQSIFSIKPSHFMNNPDATAERFKRALERLKEDQSEFFVISISNQSETELQGWVLLHIEGKATAKINPWFLKGHPIVPDSPEGKNMAISLFEYCIEFVSKRKITRIELMYPGKMNQNGEIDDYFASLYESVNFKKIQDLIHMRQEIQSKNYVDLELPKKFTLKSLNSISIDEFFDIFCRIFETGQDQSFLDLNSNSERRDYFDSHLSEDNSFDDKSSLILLHNKEIIGFAFVRHTHGTNNGNLWSFGIDHNFRGRGLGKMLLGIVLNTLKNQGMQSMSLNVDYSNIAAYNLYKKMGFAEDWISIARSWKTEFDYSKEK
ncbi:MAG: GNAT family N-acetyltransferase [Candidatus Kariarchaeaceae archaeon]|jgi:ribosomal protein S18 acetylase RimI-like enzyme